MKRTTHQSLTHRFSRSSGPPFALPPKQPGSYLKLIAATQSPTLDHVPTDLPPILGQKRPWTPWYNVKDLESTVRIHFEENTRTALAKAERQSRVASGMSRDKAGLGLLQATPAAQTQSNEHFPFAVFGSTHSPTPLDHAEHEISQRHEENIPSDLESAALDLEHHTVDTNTGAALSQDNSEVEQAIENKALRDGGPQDVSGGKSLDRPWARFTPQDTEIDALTRFALYLPPTETSADISLVLTLRSAHLLTLCT